MSQVVGLPNNSYKPITNMAIRNPKMEERGTDARVSKRPKFDLEEYSPGTSKHFIPDVLVQRLLISAAVHCDRELLNISVKSEVYTTYVS